MRGIQILVMAIWIAIGCSGSAQTPKVPSKIVLPGEKIYPEFQANPKHEVRLRCSWGYISVQVFEAASGAFLGLTHYAPDGKPMQSLQERTVIVQVNDGKGKRKLGMRNSFGSLSSRKLLPPADSWNLIIDLKSVRDGIDDDTFNVKFKKEWVKRLKKE